MPSIDLHVSVSLPAALVGPELLAILKAIESQTPPFENFAISTDLSNLHLPNAAHLSVPIAVQIGRAHGAAPQRIDFAFSATDKTALFPSFAGSLRCDAEGPSKTTVWLIGDYTPPFGYVGAILDRTMLHNVAEQTLTPFLEAIVAFAQSSIKHREHGTIRAERFNQ